MEQWKDIKDYEGYYQISNFGNVRSLDREVMNGGVLRRLKGKPMKLLTDKSGYKHIDISKDGKRKSLLVHRLIAQAFIGDIEDYVINHKNNLPYDNRIDNLELVSQRENVCHGFKFLKTTSKYPGVSQHKKDGRWRAAITIIKKNIYLGIFDTEIEAHQSRLKYEIDNKITNKYNGTFN